LAGPDRADCAIGHPPREVKRVANEPKTRSRAIGRLTAVQVDKTSKPGILMDGGGLLLRVTPTGKKWLFRYMSPTTHKRREMGLGSAEKGFVGLKEAREKADDARAQVRRGVDPIDGARQVKNERTVTFGEFADDWMDRNLPQNRNAKHRDQWRMTMTEYAAPLRSTALNAISTDNVLVVLKPIWTKKPETAKRTQGRIERILDAARAAGHLPGDNPARWRGHLSMLLPARRMLSRGHHPALPYKAAQEFMAGLRAQEGVAARALEFLILTAARSGEVRGATWAEVDPDQRQWTVPASRMKAGRPHRVPLTDKALAILADMERHRAGPPNRNDFLFPGAKEGAPLSDMTLAAVIKRMHAREVDAGRAGLLDPVSGRVITVHGFRSMFRDWAEDEAGFPFGTIKAALAHSIADKVDAAYRRGDAFEMRLNLMTTWENFLADRSKLSNILDFRFAPSASVR
jgi:integrase